MCYKHFSTGSEDVQKPGTKQNPKPFKTLTVILTPLISISKNSYEKYTEKVEAFTIFPLVQRLDNGYLTKILLQ